MGLTYEERIAIKQKIDADKRSRVTKLPGNSSGMKRVRDTYTEEAAARYRATEAARRKGIRLRKWMELGLEEIEGTMCLRCINCGKVGTKHSAKTFRHEEGCSRG